MVKMDKIKDIVPKILLETAHKYIQTEKELARGRRERFKDRVIKVTRNYLRAMTFGGIVIILAIAGILFLRARNDA